ncbi:MAG: enoyl-CoA hydratase-related protein [Pseudomonadota bacterium]
MAGIAAEPVLLAEGGLSVEVSDATAIITLHRPETLNAMTQAMWSALPGALDSLSGDARVKVVLLTGAGDAFCAGADVSEFPSTFADAGAARAYNDLVEAARHALTHVPKATIAVVPGLAVGAGCGLAIACDLRFAADTARLGMPPARLGAAYPFPGVRQLVGLIGPARARDMLYSGRLVSADEASRIGLIDRICTARSLMDEAHRYAAGLCTLSTNSQRITKRMVQTVLDGIDDETDELRALFDQSFADDDFLEGYQAFLEKRKPQFR